MSFYNDKNELFTLDPQITEKDDLANKYNLLRKICMMQELQIARFVQFFHMETEYKETILNLDRSLETGDIDLSGAIDFLENPWENLYEVADIKKYDTEM